MNSSMLISAPPLPRVSQSAVSTDAVLPASCDQAVPAEAPPVARPAPGVWEVLLWTFVFFLVCQLIPGVVVAIWSIDAAGNFDMPSELLLPTVLVGQILGVCLSVLLLRVRVGRSWRSALQIRRPRLIPCLLAVACVPALMLVGFGVEKLVEHLMGAKEPTQELIIASMSHYSMWFCLLVIAVGAAVNEELFCRGFLGRGLVGRYGILIGVLVTSVIFGVIHLNLPQGIWACILGCFLHLAYLATRSLWAPMLLHFVNNAIAVLVYSAWPDFDLTMGQLLMIAVPAYLIAIPAAWALYRLREPQVAEAPVV